ncbi:MAG: ABC transporter permease [Chloroflexi bacterium]|nr:ABC transporter permease [Chloroflexota bacterium]
MKKIRSFFKFLGKIEALPVVAVLLIMIATFMITAPDVFLKYRIYMSILQTVTPPLILGLGLTFVITAGEIDLSFPAIVALSGFVFAWGYQNLDQDLGRAWATWASFGLALGAGAFAGFINGVLIAKVGVPSIMATLAAQFFWYGATIEMAGGRTWRLKGIQEDQVWEVFVRRIYGIIPQQGRAPIGVPTQALWALGLTIFLWFILNRHKFGESIMFIGDNANVARVMGVNVVATKIRLFTMMGIIAAFAGLILTLQVGVSYPTQGEGMLLLVMAAVFIGGTSIAGGYGSIIGTFFGAFIIISLEPGIVATKVSGYWVQLIEGLVLGASVTLHVIIGEHNIAAFSDRIRRWSTPVRLVQPASEKDSVHLP